MGSSDMEDGQAHVAGLIFVKKSEIWIACEVSDL